MEKSMEKSMESILVDLRKMESWMESGKEKWKPGPGPRVGKRAPGGSGRDHDRISRPLQNLCPWVRRIYIMKVD